MKWDQFEENWQQLRGRLKEHWGRLSDNDLDAIAGKRDQLIERLQERYGMTNEEAQTQLEVFLKRQ
jgi:uncharacterized protein YjbJ (UPF0337 family)